jgi:hypothetical protein
MPAGKIKNLRGEQGSVSVNSEASPVGVYTDFVVMQDCTVDSVLMPKEGNDVADYAGDYAQGFVFYGPLTQVTLSAGVVMLHNSQDPRIPALQTN